MLRLLSCLCLLCCSCAFAQTAPRYGVVISEILADPSPAVGLPAGEFVEIRNTLPFPVSLDRWQLATSRGMTLFPPGIVLASDSFLVVCARSQEPAFAARGRAVGLSGFPSLDNTGDTLSLRDAQGTTMHAVAYTLSWYGHSWKNNGGWSLELIDHQLPCLESGNWGASTDPSGGTPGRKNSIEGIGSDTIPPILLRTYMRDSITLTAVFSETLDSLKAADAGLYALTDGIGTAVLAMPRPPLFREVELRLSAAPALGGVFLLRANGIADCAGNRVAEVMEAHAGRPTAPSPGIVCINEILFNPWPGGSDYVELYHRGPSPIDLAAVYLANRTDQGLITSLQPCADRQYFLYPGEYIVLTTDTSSVRRDYPDANPSLLLEMAQLPSYPDDAGTVVLSGISGLVLDQCSYTEKMHYALLTSRDGVALERIDPDAPASDPTNWFSAPASHGYGTPTYRNGQYRKPQASGTTMRASPTVFSPDLDGQDDQLALHYQFPAPGYTCSIMVYDQALRLVRQLVRNQSCAVEGVFRWDGLGDRQQQLPAGIYYIVSECFTLQGRTTTHRQAVAITYRQ